MTCALRLAKRLCPQHGNTHRLHICLSVRDECMVSAAIPDPDHYTSLAAACHQMASSQGDGIAETVLMYCCSDGYGFGCHACAADAWCSVLWHEA